MTCVCLHSDVKETNKKYYKSALKTIIVLCILVRMPNSARIRHKKGKIGIYNLYGRNRTECRGTKGSKMSDGIFCSIFK